jgi:hypothetical protein
LAPKQFSKFKPVGKMSGDIISGEEIQNIGPFHLKFGERSNQSSYKLSEMIFCKYEPTRKY